MYCHSGIGMVYYFYYSYLNTRFKGERHMTTQITDVVIEVLEEKEKEQYAQVLLESYAQYKEVYPSEEAWQQYAQDIVNSVNLTTYDQILVAKVAGEIVGGLHLFTDGELAYGRDDLNIQNTIIRLLGVHPNGRGKGVAKQLIQESIAFARARGDEYVYLHSTYMMATAIELYKKIGFTPDPTRNFNKNNILVQCFRYKL